MLKLRHFCVWVRSLRLRLPFFTVSVDCDKVTDNEKFSSSIHTRRCIADAGEEIGWPRAAIKKIYSRYYFVEKRKSRMTSLHLLLRIAISRGYKLLRWTIVCSLNYCRNSTNMYAFVYMESNLPKNVLKLWKTRTKCVTEYWVSNFEFVTDWFSSESIYFFFFPLSFVADFEDLSREMASLPACHIWKWFVGRTPRKP